MGGMEIIGPEKPKRATMTRPKSKPKRGLIDPLLGMSICGHDKETSIMRKFEQRAL
jgi:hypothetical protein